MTGSGGREEDGSRRPNSDEEEYKVESVRERITASRGSRFNLIEKQLRIEATRRRFSRENLINGIKCLVIHPDSRYVRFSRTSIRKLFRRILKRCDFAFLRLRLSSEQYPYSRNLRRRRKTTSAFNSNSILFLEVYYYYCYFNWSIIYYCNALNNYYSVFINSTNTF